METRVVLPLLSRPEFLSIPHGSIRSKNYLTPQRIDKAAGRTTGYYPDYSIWDGSFPLLIVEAKAPAVEADVGYREASQYALHLNRQYRAGLNPCGYILATNGIRLLAGAWDSNPEIDVKVEDITPGSEALERLRARIGQEVLHQRGIELRQLVSAEGIFSPAKGPLATTLINSKVPPNQFASALIPTLTRYFASPTDDADPAVYDTGYVPTDEQISYDSILEGLLREKAHAYKNPLSRDVLTTKTSTKGFTERIEEYSSSQVNTPQLLLVIGHVGAGKSLFIRRYREILVPESISEKLYWGFIDFNDAPKGLSGATSWVARQFVESFSSEQPSIDLYDGDMLEHIFSVELKKNKSIYDELRKIDQLSAIKERGSDLKALMNDPEAFSRGITRYFSGDRSGVCIAVFDNVDRLDKDDQLAAFQLALSFMAEHRTLTILQLRDETFERYKDSKPLDTFKTGISFHITPPRFATVVRRRLEIAITDLSANAPKSWEYDLSNGVRVNISRNQALSFLHDVYEYVFGPDVNASRVLQGLAGRNVRRALDIFFRVMISGHLASDQITSVATGGTSFPITDDLVLRTLMRGDYRFFHSGSGFVSNIYLFEKEWNGADNIIVPEILFFLASKMKTRGTIGLEGFFTVDGIFENLQILGYPREAVQCATEWMLKRGLVEADNMSTDDLTPNAAVRISSSGFIHIRVLSARLEYVAGCLYEIPYLTREMAGLAGQMLKDSVGTGGLSRTRKAQGVQEFRKYLRQLKQRREEIAPNLVGVPSAIDYILRHVEVAIAEAIRPLKPLPTDPDPLDL